MGNNATLKGTNSSETQGRKHQSDASDPIDTCKKLRLSAHASAEECAEGPFTEIPLVKPEDGNVKQEEEVVVNKDPDLYYSLLTIQVSALILWSTLMVLLTSIYAERLRTAYFAYLSIFLRRNRRYSALKIPL